MKPIHIFRPGKHTSSNGQALEFTESDLAASAAAYDPSVHEAPIVIGHPADNGPAFGWVSGLSFADGNLHAEPDQIDADFAELVEAGRYKKVSASFYRPDASNNPVPGTYYLRHVGFLGAQPPALKGLGAIEFTEDGADQIIEFGDFTDMQTAGLWRRVREFFIEKFGIEDADKVVPGFIVEDLEAAAREPAPDAPAFTEDDQTGESDMTKAEIQQLQADLAAANTTIAGLEASATSFTERETSIAAREATLATAEHASFVDGLVAKGKVLPAEKASLVALMATLDNTAEVSFTEGEGDAAKTTKQGALDAFKAQLEARPQVIDLGEHGAGDGADDTAESPGDFAERITVHKANREADGVTLSFSQASKECLAGKDKAAA